MGSEAQLLIDLEFWSLSTLFSPFKVCNTFPIPSSSAACTHSCFGTDTPSFPQSHSVSYYTMPFKFWVPLNKNSLMAIQYRLDTTRWTMITRTDNCQGKRFYVSHNTHTVLLKHLYYKMRRSWVLDAQLAILSAIINQGKTNAFYITLDLYLKIINDGMNRTVNIYKNPK